MALLGRKVTTKFHHVTSTISSEFLPRCKIEYGYNNQKLSKFSFCNFTLRDPQFEACLASQGLLLIKPDGSSLDAFVTYLVCFHIRLDVDSVCDVWVSTITSSGRFSNVIFMAHNLPV